MLRAGAGAIHARIRARDAVSKNRRKTNAIQGQVAQIVNSVSMTRADGKRGVLLRPENNTTRERVASMRPCAKELAWAGVPAYPP